MKLHVNTNSLETDDLYSSNTHLCSFTLFSSRQFGARIVLLS